MCRRDKYENETCGLSKKLMRHVKSFSECLQHGTPNLCAQKPKKFHADYCLKITIEL